MTRAALRSRWRAEIYRDRTLPAVVRITLLALSDRMREDGYVSVPRTDLVRTLDRTDRRVREHLAAAIDAGMLARVSRGYEGHTAVYRATLPKRPENADANRQRGTDGGPPERGLHTSPLCPDGRGAASAPVRGGRTGGRPLISTDPYVAGSDRYVGTDEHGSPDRVRNDTDRQRELSAWGAWGAGEGPPRSGPQPTAVRHHNSPDDNGSVEDRPRSPMVGRTYLDPGDRLAGPYDPPRLCAVEIAGRASTRGDAAGPRTALVRYLDDDSRAVIPVTRRLRRVREEAA